jgi:hypothetical protein
VISSLSQFTCTLSSSSQLSDIPRIDPDSTIYLAESICQDGATLSYYSILPNSTLVLTPTLPPAPTAIYLQCIFGALRSKSRHFFAIPSNSSVAHLRLVLGRNLSVAPARLLLRCRKVWLEDRFPISHYQITAGATIRATFDSPASLEIARVGVFRQGCLQLRCVATPVNQAGQLAELLEGEVYHGWISPLIVQRETRRLLAPNAFLSTVQIDRFVVADLLTAADSYVSVVYEGMCFVIEICEYHSVFDLKCRLAALLKVPAARQILTKGGRKLLDGFSIAQARLLREDCWMSLAPESGATIDVIVGDLVVKVPVQDGGQRISDVKMELRKRIGMSEGDFSLSLPAKRFAEEDRGKSLWELGIHDGSLLFVLGKAEVPVPALVQLPAGEIVVDVEQASGVGQLREAVSRLTAGGRGMMFTSGDERVSLAEGEAVDGPMIVLLA